MHSLNKFLSMLSIYGFCTTLRNEIQTRLGLCSTITCEHSSQYGWTIHLNSYHSETVNNEDQIKM
jgi:hypothetical protein